MNSRYDTKCTKVEKFWLALSPLWPAWTLCEVQARRGCYFFCRAFLPRATNPIIGTWCAAFPARAAFVS